jgi:Zn finger protein HypA/HybF involved in hydrogenase expression
MLAILLMAAAAWAQTDNMLGPHNTNNTFGCQSCHAPHSQVLAGNGLYLWGLSVPAGTYKTYGGGTMTAGLTSGIAPTDTSVHTVLCLSCHDQTFNAIMAGGKGTSPTTNMSTPIAGFSGSGDGTFTSITGGVASASFDISANHPVHVLYPNVNGAHAAGYDNTTAFKYWALKSASASFVDTGTVFTYGHTVSIKLDSGNNAYVECGTCHNPHSQSVAVVTVGGTRSTVGTAHFIRGEYDNTQSQAAFCMSCHADKSLAWNGTGAQ